MMCVLFLLSVLFVNIFFQIGELTGHIVHLKVGTNNVEFQGRQLETQSVTVEDAGGKIRLQLWDSQVGVALFGKTYKFCNLSTREFNGEFFSDHHTSDDHRRG